MNRVSERREQKIQQAVAQGNWEEVLHLLDQPFENSLRKDRYYQLGSIEFQVSEKSTLADIELVDYDDAVNILARVELIEAIYKLLATLDEIDQRIFELRAIEMESFRQISQEISLSDKIVKRRYEKTVGWLQQELTDFF
ncbi:sigma factor-like helix-turn-helix DNA-binding protein [Streptococcus thermophilus]|uniref:sigma factor-like helix-turn-helix DNA-binding protein n=1 Tax=Streptococcus thermophilus TaxID=1308 RepID=UPI001108CA98|nr:sigma factor-like helix-turn-helix DNA-binding protein [Streptococcus thermophilus]MBO1155957.1 sigma-70 family RNA polymerase sigma factor [Streptococcus thermophilus]MBO1160908.1 sigma-70 family RNA polymerase sigma factor [Streptococcus thermophilus]QTA39753.1 sigma-70 family RNA polymerase sigma factor [Streptococcus thermophilus]QTA46366.1 sigma-70 family RNA polymerase sigma factor [Streptococcus thermophilus]TLP92048.1 sigma-70 family RNA polymerase sigma factor [Streptococcus thermo